MLGFSTKSGQSQKETEARGRLLADVLSGAWRTPTVPIVSADELAETSDLLLSSGASSLAWRRVRHTELQNCAAADQLHQAYRFHSLEAAVNQDSLKRASRLLRNAEIDAVLVKGWAIARHYPESGMRPYSDLDFCVSPKDFDKAKTVLQRSSGRVDDVDLHKGFGKFLTDETDQLIARSKLIELDDVQVRVLSEEDHLRLLCTHMLRHGVVRPLWLCDVAVLLESQTGNFDWGRCLSGSRGRAGWVSCAVMLARELVGLRLDDIPAQLNTKLPGWVVTAVLREWGKAFRFPAQVSAYLRSPREFLKELPRHWPNPIEATASVGGPFNRIPRFPFQVGHVFSRAAALLLQIAGLSEGVRTS